MVALAFGQRRADVERKSLGDRRRLDRRQRQRGLHELAAFGRVAAQDPEALQRDRELDGDERVDALRERQGDGAADVVELDLEPPQPVGLLGSSQPVPRRLGQREVVVAVPRRDRGRVVALGQLLAHVLADRFEHQVARAVVAFHEHHERLLDQRLQQVEHVLGGERLDAAHRFGRGEIEAADEHAEPVEHDLLFGREQLVRPVDEGAQGLLPLLQDARAAGQQLVAVRAGGH